MYHYNTSDVSYQLAACMCAFWLQFTTNVSWRTNVWFSQSEKFPMWSVFSVTALQEINSCLKSFHLHWLYFQMLDLRRSSCGFDGGPCCGGAEIRFGFLPAPANRDWHESDLRMFYSASGPRSPSLSRSLGLVCPLIPNFKPVAGGLFQASTSSDELSQNKSSMHLIWLTVCNAQKYGSNGKEFCIILKNASCQTL